MTEKFKKIEANEIDSRSVARLATTPTKPMAFGESGFDAKALKARFDMLPIYIIERLNEIFEGITSGDLAGAMVTGKGNRLGKTVDNIVDGETDLKVNTATGKDSLRRIAQLVLMMYSGLPNGELADKIFLKREQLESLNSVIDRFAKELAKLPGLEEASREWVRFSGGDYKDFYATSMKELDKLEENDKSIDFSGTYNRVYVNLSGGRGDYGRYCLTEAPIAPVDPDGKYFAHGEGKYYPEAPDRVLYHNFTEESFLGYQGVDMNSVFQDSFSLYSRADASSDKYLWVEKNKGSQATITFLKSGSKLRKCVFETEMFIDMDGATLNESDAWLIRFGFVDESKNIPSGFNNIRIKYNSNNNALSLHNQTNNGVTIPLKQWFLLQIETIDDKAYVICDGMLAAVYSGCALDSFAGVRLEMRSASYVNNFRLGLDNSCVVSTNESTPSAVTLSSVAQRTKQGHLRVPKFVLGEEPSEEYTLYKDEIAVPFAYVESMQSEILDGLNRVIAEQEKILGGEE